MLHDKNLITTYKMKQSSFPPETCAKLHKPLGKPRAAVIIGYVTLISGPFLVILCCGSYVRILIMLLVNI